LELNRKALANAAAVTAAVLWVICSMLVAGLPQLMMSMTGHMVHLDTQSFSWVMSIPGFLVGLVIWMVAAWATGWLIAVFYNRFSSQ